MIRNTFTFMKTKCQCLSFFWLLRFICVFNLILNLFPLCWLFSSPVFVLVPHVITYLCISFTCSLLTPCVYLHLECHLLFGSLFSIFFSVPRSFLSVLPVYYRFDFGIFDSCLAILYLCLLVFCVQFPRLNWFPWIPLGLIPFGLERLPVFWIWTCLWSLYHAKIIFFNLPWEWVSPPVLRGTSALFFPGSLFLLRTVWACLYSVSGVGFIRERGSSDQPNPSLPNQPSTHSTPNYAHLGRSRYWGFCFSRLQPSLTNEHSHRICQSSFGG